MFDRTEALLSVDINSARATKGSDIEETALNTNLEAADEIARQLRLRDLGGLIVIDFIDMTPARHQREVENRLRDALKFDRARVQVGRISRFGLLEMSRQRLRSSLSETTQDVCPRCNGQGSIRSIESLTLSIIRLLKEESVKEGTIAVHVQLPISAATYLSNEKRDAISAIEKDSETRILLIPNPNLHTPQYEVTRIKSNTDSSGGNGKSSYRLINDIEQDTATQQLGNNKTIDQPVVQPISRSAPPARGLLSGGQLVKKVWSSLFKGGEKTEETATTADTESASSSTTTEKRNPQRGSHSDNNKNKGRSRGQGRRGGNQQHNRRRNRNQQSQQNQNKSSSNNQQKTKTEQKKTPATDLAATDKTAPTESQPKNELTSEAPKTSQKQEHDGSSDNSDNNSSGGSGRSGGRGAKGHYARKRRGGRRQSSRSSGTQKNDTKSASTDAASTPEKVTTAPSSATDAGHSDE